MKRSSKIKIITGVAGLGIMTACGYNVPSDMVAVHVGSGPFESKKIKGCVNPGERALTGNDKYVLLPGPSNQREFDATGQKDSDAGVMTSVTKDNVLMNIPVTVRFSIKGDCENLKAFYTNYIRRYGVEFKEDGSYNDKWDSVVRKLVGDPADATLDRIVQNYDWRKVWNDPGTKTEIEKKLQEALSSNNSLMVQTANGDYFDGISVVVGQPAPARQELADAVSLEQTNVAKAQSSEAQAKADTAKARAEVAVAEAEAAKKRAEIAGFGDIDSYLKAKMIANGLNPYQPSYGAPVVNTK